MASFENPKISTLKIKVDLDEDGFIARTDETKKKTKTQNVKGFRFNGTTDEATTLLQKIVGDIGKASYDSSTGKQVATYKVDKPRYEDVYNEIDFFEADIAPIFAGTRQLTGKLDWSEIDNIFSGTRILQAESIFGYNDFDKTFEQGE